MSLNTLKSGSDLRGVAVAQSGSPATLTPEAVRRVGLAFARLTAARLGKEAGELTFAVGHDSRITGEALAGAMIAGLSAAGAAVHPCGLCTTPAMFLTTQPTYLGLDGAVMITASHHPWNRNGCKFFWPQGGLSGEDIDALIRAAEAAPDPGEHLPISSPVDFLQTYQRFLQGLFQENLGGATPLAGLAIVVDAGGGAGGFYADLLARLGANTQGSQFLAPDGMFSGHIPNPEDETAIRSLGEAVRRSGAGLGVIFDADCDRAAIVDRRGEPVHRNRLVALTAGMVLSGHPGATIVTDSVTSLGLTRYIQALGGKHLRYRRGYRNVIEEAVRLNQAGVDCPLAIETSGHAALRENHFLDDGMYLVTRLIIFLCQNGLGEDPDVIARLLAGLPEPAESIEIRLPITQAEFASAGQQALKVFEAAAAAQPGWQLATDSHEGVRVLFTGQDGTPAGFVMLRLSVHDPVLPLNAESDAPGALREMLGAVSKVLSPLPGIDWNELLAAVK